MTEPTQIKVNVNLPDELEAGVFASFASIWRDNEGFVLDFAVTTAPGVAQTDETGETFVGVQAKVVSRVRIPASQAWEFMRALNSQLSAWENEHGLPPNAT
jgi:hypothetical protein